MAINKEYNDIQLDVKFTQASTRANLVSEENISVSFGKISKYFADLHSQAFTGYSHPTHTAYSSGLYKITVDGLGHVTSAATVTGSDLPAHEHPYLPLAGGTLTGRVTTSKFLNYIVKGTGTTGADKGSGQNPRYVPAKWTFNTGQTASDGDVIIIKIPVAGHDYGVYISIDNGTTYHPVVISGSSRLTTHYGNGNYAVFTFRGDGSASSMIPLAGNTDGARVTVTGGVWQGIDYYDSGNTYDRTSQQTRIYVGGVGVFRYSICGLNSEQRMESFTTTGDASGSPTTTKTFNTSAKFSYPPVIMYNDANAAYSSGSVISNNVLYEQFPSLDMRYSCNKTSSASTGFTQYKPVFIECTFDDKGFWSITSNGFVQTFTSGKYYILVGCMYNKSVYQLAMFAQHPVYYYDGTNLTMVPFTKAEKTKLAGISEGANKTEASSNNGKIKIDGTDTTVYTHPSYTSKTSGLYKITVDSTGHVSGTAVVTASDLPAHTHSDYVLKTGDTMSGNLTFAVADGSDTPGIVFKRGNFTDSTLDWKIYNSSGALMMDRTVAGDTETWQNKFKVDGEGIWYSGTKVSLVGHTHNYAGSNSTGGSALTVYGTLTNPSGQASYAIPFHTDISSGDKSLLNNDGIVYTCKQGTASATGFGIIELGNAIDEGTAGNKYGLIRLYSRQGGGKYIQLYSTTKLTANRNIMFPNAAGTVALTTDIPTVNDASLTLKGDGTDVVVFTANSANNKSLDITAGANVTINPTVDSGTGIGSIEIASSHPTITKSADTTSTASPGHGGTFTVVDSVTREANGHVTKINTKTITLPADNDYRVKQENTTTSAEYRLLFSNSANDTTENAAISRKGTNLRYNPSTKSLYAGYYGSDPSITARLTSLNFTSSGAGTGRTKVRFDLATTSLTTGAPPAESGKNSSGHVTTYSWDSNIDVMTQIYIPNGDHVGSSYGPQPLMIRGDDSGTWLDWRGIATFSQSSGSITSGQVVITDGTLGLVKASGYTIAKSVPSDAVFTDTKVTQTADNSSNSDNYELLISNSANNTTETAGARKSSRLRFNPSNGRVIMQGPLIVRATDGAGSYDEGIRINAGKNGYSTLTFGGGQDTIRGTADGQFWVGTNSTDDSYKRKLYIAHATSTGSGTYFYASSATQGSPALKLGTSGSIANGNGDAVTGGVVYTALSNYLPLSGGTMTGDITFTGVGTSSYPSKSKGIYWSGGTDTIEMYYNVRSADAGELIINMKDDTNVRTSFAYNGTVKSYIDTNGTYNGNASTADKWKTARTLSLTGAVTGSASIDGSGNASLSTTVNHTHPWNDVTDKPVIHYGYNTSVGNTTDWNTLTEAGCYKIQMASWGDAATYHSPNGYKSDIYSFGLLFNVKSGVAGENRLAQIYMPHNKWPIVVRWHNGSDYTTGWGSWAPIYYGISKSDVGLGNVENKSSATIRGEITSSNVTTALGYTPLNKAGDTMTGALHVSDTGTLIFDYTSGADAQMFTLKGATNYGIRYKEGSPDTMKFSASGNANTDAGADLCINGNGDGTVTIRGNTILHAGNTSWTQTVTSSATGAYQIGKVKINNSETTVYGVNTDTKNTAGSTDTSSKIFLIGATSQATNPQTYSDNEVYTTSGVLTTKKVQVGGGHCTMEYNSTTETLDFVFA